MEQAEAKVRDALGALWAAIQEQDPRVPDAAWQVVTHANARHSPVTDDPLVLPISIQVLQGPGDELLEYVLHLAAHTDGGWPAASQEGRYHSRAFKEAAERVGLDGKLSKTGFSQTSLAVGTRGKFATERRDLRHAVAAWNPTPVRARSRGPLSIVCACSPPRRLSASPGVLARGDVICGLCGEPFKPKPKVGAET